MGKVCVFSNCTNEKNISALRLTFLDYHDKVILALDQLEC